MSYQVLQGDARDLPLDDDSVDLIVTSPPYFALRSYRDDGGHYDGQIGSEPTPTEFLDALVECTGEMVRVLKPSGSIFVNLGDKFSGAGPQNAKGRLSSRGNSKHWQQVKPRGIPAKSRMLLPHRYAIRAIDELGLICRMDMVWSKPNGLPESVSDRVRASHEYWFHLVKSPRYFTGIDEIREQYAPTTLDRYKSGPHSVLPDERSVGKGAGYIDENRDANPLGRLPGSVWNIPSEPLLIPDSVRETRDLPDHFAAFPQEWPRRLILGFSPTGICCECEQPRRAVREVDWSKVPHTMVEKRVISARASAEWCLSFAEFCDSHRISRGDLDAAAGTSDMGGWWASRLPHRAQVPTVEQWEKLKRALPVLDGMPHRIEYEITVVPVAEWDTPDADQAGRNKTTKPAALSSGEYRTITGYECACAPVGDPAPTRPAVVLDPFGGTGTTAGVAHTLGRHGISVDLSADYCRLAEWRITESGHFDKSRQRMWADRQTQLL